MQKKVQVKKNHLFHIITFFRSFFDANYLYFENWFKMSRTKQKLLSTESKRFNVFANLKLKFCCINCLKFKLLLKVGSTLSRHVSDYNRIFNLFKSEFESDQVWVWVWSSLSLSLIKFEFEFDQVCLKIFFAV